MNGGRECREPKKKRKPQKASDEEGEGLQNRGERTHEKRGGDQRSDWPGGAEEGLRRQARQRGRGRGKPNGRGRKGREREAGEGGGKRAKKDGKKMRCQRRMQHERGK